MPHNYAMPYFGRHAHGHEPPRQGEKISDFAAAGILAPYWPSPSASSSISRVRRGVMPSALPQCRPLSQSPLEHDDSRHYHTPEICLMRRQYLQFYIIISARISSHIDVQCRQAIYGKEE